MDAGHVDILAQFFHVVPAQKQAVEEGGFPLRGQGIEFVSRHHKTDSAKCQYTSALVDTASPISASRILLPWISLGGIERCPNGSMRRRAFKAAGNKPKLIDEYIGV